jgi:molecular chaperone DnaK
MGEDAKGPAGASGPSSSKGPRRYLAKVKLPCANLDEVRAKHPELERGRFCLRSAQDRPVGAPIRLEATLRDGTPCFVAVATLEKREPVAGGAARWTLAISGMDDAGRELVAWMRGVPPGQLDEAAAPDASEPGFASPDEVVEIEVTGAVPVARPTPVPVARPTSTPPPVARPTPPAAVEPAAPAAATTPPPAPAPRPARARPAEPRGPPPTLAVPAPLPAAAAVEPDDAPPPAPRKGGPIIGIDLGTTNSAAAFVKAGKPYIIPSREGYSTIPSMVALTDKGTLVVGHAAKGRMLVDPRNTVHGAKRLIGRQFKSPVVADLAGRFTYPIVPGPRGEAAVKLGDKTYSLQKISAMVLSQVKGLAQQWLGEEVGRAVITVPAYYNDNQRQAVRQAGALAGLDVVRIVNEPTAAAIAFAAGRKTQQRVMVYDLGGGTFDTSLLELHGNVYEVVATGGDTFLGGVDFDKALVDELLSRFEKAHGVSFAGDHVAYQRITDAAERAKIALSERLTTDVDVPFVTLVDGDAYSLQSRVTRAELEAITRGLVERTLRVCDDVLTNAGLSPGDVGEVLLVGGQSRMPMVRTMIREFFGKEPTKSVHPDEAVALGAALLADSIQSDDIGGMVLVDVLPMSIGVGLPGGRFKKVIERNTPLPHRRTHTIWTSGDREKTLSIAVFQGESARAQENEYLGTLVVADLPPGTDGEVVFDVVFSISAESILTVTAEERGTARTVSATFSTQETPEAIRRRLERGGDAAPAGDPEPDADKAPAVPPAAAPDVAAPPVDGSALSRMSRWVRQRVAGRS